MLHTQVGSHRPTELIFSRNVKVEESLLSPDHSGSRVWFIVRAVVIVISSQESDQELRGLRDLDSNETVGAEGD